MAGASRDNVIDFEFLRGRLNEMIFKDMCVASDNVRETFRFKNLYKMADHGSSEKGINWADGHIDYKNFHTWLMKPWSVFLNSTPTASLNLRFSLPIRDVRSIF